MFDLSILIPQVAPLLIVFTAPAFRLRQRDRHAGPLFSQTNSFNHLLLDQRGITGMEYAVVAGTISSVAWVVFVALGTAFSDIASGTAV